MNFFFRISALVGFFGVALGAFGAHALKPLLERNGLANIWEKAVLFHLVHAVVLLVVASRNPLPLLSWSLTLAGIIFFSGSLYIYAASQFRPMVFVTPLGGLCLLASWLMLALLDVPR